MTQYCHTAAECGSLTNAWLPVFLEHITRLSLGRKYQGVWTRLEGNQTLIINSSWSSCYVLLVFFQKSKARIGSASKGYQEKPASFNVSATAFTYDAAGVYPITDFDKLLLHLLVALVEGNFHQFPPWLDLGRALWFSGIGIGSTLQKSLTWKARAYENCRNFHINHGCPQDRFMWSAKRFISRER